MAFDLRNALRSLKPQGRTAELVLLDTSVYLDVFQGGSPGAVDDLLSYRPCHNSAVSIAELTHVFGRLDPPTRRRRQS